MTAIAANFITRGCLALLPSASTSAEAIDLVTLLLLGITGFFILLVGFLILVFSVKYRAGVPGPRKVAGPIHMRTELYWIGTLLVLLMATFVYAARVFVHVQIPPDHARTIYVVGKQWMWKVQHPGGRREINQLHVPIGEPVKLVLTSQDVIHSFFIPAFRIKQDVFPNRYTTLWFQATLPGEYHLFCAEYCGSEHALMRGRVVVMKPSDFQRWLGAQPPPQQPVPGLPGTPTGPLALGGESAFYRFGCNACHVPHAAVRAPRLDGLFGQEVLLRSSRSVIADENYLRESILSPNARIVAGYDSPSLMPSYAGQISPEELIELIEFIKSLREGWPSEIAP